MRRRSRLIMFIVAISFVVGFGLLSLGGLLEAIRQVTSGESDRPRRADELGRVGNKIITQTEYDNLKNLTKWRFIENTGTRNVPNEVEEQFAKQAWDELVQDNKFQDIYKRLKIDLLFDEVMQILRMAPPRDVMGDSAFYTDGKLDQKKYEQILYTQRFVQLHYFEYRDFVRSTRLQSDLNAALRVTDNQMHDDLNRERTTYDYGFVSIEPSKFVPEPTPKEAWSYFLSHRSQFDKPPRRTMRLAVFPLKVTADDSASAKAQIDDVYASLQTDEDFLAQTDRYNDSLGSWFKFDTLTDSIRAAVNRLAPGQHSEPVLSERSWQIVRLEERSGDSVRLRFITAPIEIGSAAYADVRDKIDNLTERVKGGEKFDSVARELGAQLRDMPPLERGKSLQFEPEVAGNIEIFARHAKVGEVSPPLRNPRNEIYVVQLTGIVSGLASPTDSMEIRDRAMRQLAMDRALPLMRAHAEKFYQAAKAMGSLQKAAEGDTLVHYVARKESPIFALLRYPGAATAGALSALQPGEMSGIIHEEGGFFIVQCDARKEFNGTDEHYADARIRTDADRLGQELRKPVNITDWRNPFSL